MPHDLIAPRDALDLAFAARPGEIVATYAGRDGARYRLTLPYSYDSGGRRYTYASAELPGPCLHRCAPGSSTWRHAKLRLHPAPFAAWCAAADAWLDPAPPATIEDQLAELLDLAARGVEPPAPAPRPRRVERLDLVRDFAPISAVASSLAARLRSGRPTIITQRGEPVAVLLDLAAWEALCKAAAAQSS